MNKVDTGHWGRLLQDLDSSEVQDEHPAAAMDTGFKSTHPGYYDIKNY